MEALSFIVGHSDDRTTDETYSIERKRINNYKNHFSKKTTTQLEIIIDNNELLPEARMAAKEIIEVRRTQ